MNFTPAPTKLKRQNWCGPFALSIMAGQDYDTAYPRILRSLRAFTKRRYANANYSVKLPTFLRGMFDFEVTAVAKTFGYKIEWMRPPENDRKIAPTVKQLLDHLKPRRFYLVNITDHYITIDTWNWLWCDNHSKKWMPLDNCKWSRTRVKRIAEYQPKWRKECA